MTNKSGALGFATCIRLMKRDIKSQAWLDSLPLVPRSVCFTFVFGWSIGCSLATNQEAGFYENVLFEGQLFDRSDNHRRVGLE
jgi:hypothetical protein